MAAVAHELGYQLGNTSLQNITYQPLDIFLPVGISFFTFQTISYVIDVYRGRIAPPPALDRLCFLCLLLPAAGGRADRPRKGLHPANPAEPHRP